MARKPNVREQRLAAMNDGRMANALAHGLAELLEDVYEEKRKAMVSAFRQGGATHEILLAAVAQLAMAEELMERLHKRVSKSRRAMNEELTDGEAHNL